jgi:hypothetical protein
VSHKNAAALFRVSEESSSPAIGAFVYRVKFIPQSRVQPPLNCGDNPVIKSAAICRYPVTDAYWLEMSGVPTIQEFVQKIDVLKEQLELCEWVPW